MLTHFKNHQTHFRGLRKAALYKAFLWQLALSLTLTAGWGDRVFAQASSDSVLERFPQSVAAVGSNGGNDLLWVQILYAGAIVWIITLMRSGKS